MNLTHASGQPAAPKHRADLQRLQELAKGHTPEEKSAALKAAAEEFEAILVYQMVGTMRKTIGEGGLLQKSNAEKIFEGMLDEEWAKKIAGREGHNTLGDLIYRELSRKLGLEEEKVPAGDPAGFMELIGSNSSFIELQRPGSQLAPLRPQSIPEQVSHE